jgi:MscS family membrane protein
MRTRATSQHLAAGLVWCLPIVLALCFLAAAASAQPAVYPLEPPDRSSPRATLNTFLNSADALAAFFAREHQPAPTRQTFRGLVSLVETPMGCLDLSELPPASRIKAGGAAAMALYETLSRIQLPPVGEIPAGDEPVRLSATNAARWVIPHTEMVLVRMATGPHAGDFLFSADTVARATEFYQRVRDLPYLRPVPVKGLYEMRITGGGWMIPWSWIEAMPSWCRSALGGQAVWKWLALVLVLGCFSLFVRVAHRLPLRVRGHHPFLHASARLLLPFFVLMVTPVVAYLALIQINFVGAVGGAIELGATAVMFLAAAWLSWRAAPVAAEAIIASPNIAPESIDAHLIRICSRLLGLIAAAGLLVIGADRVGVPVYGIIAGLGVGGLAIALAAQPTIENLIGSLNLFGDKPLRVGDFCRCGDILGTVQTIGIRSTRIRGVDRTLTTIPNATLSKLPIVNLTQRDRMLIRLVIGVRCETSAEQLRFLLAKLREMLIAHPRILAESARARLTGFGAGAREIEVFAYAMTGDWPEFLGIQEDVFLRIMDLIQQSGTGFALPSQTLYFNRDRAPDEEQVLAAEAKVRQWRAEGQLPFPNFSPAQAEGIRGSLVYPPPGSPDAKREAPSAADHPGCLGQTIAASEEHPAREAHPPGGRTGI